jgi:hypothetical protein
MRVERNVSAKSEVANRNTRLPSAQPAALSAVRLDLAQLIYIAAIAAATLGWLCLIGWIAFKLT